MSTFLSVFWGMRKGIDKPFPLYADKISDIGMLSMHAHIPIFIKP